MSTEEEEDSIHPHCQSCLRLLRCSAGPNFNCKIISCPLGCKARYHACKASEHSLLCPDKIVPCINALYGCPLKMQRKCYTAHLERCPASVVHCTMEWNRWPIQTLDSCLSAEAARATQNFSKSVATEGNSQLDVALALRDQRMLQQLQGNLPQSQQSNTMAGLYPAVPFVPYQGSVEQNGYHPNEGLSEEKSCTENDLYQASRQTTATLSAALSSALACNKWVWTFYLGDKENSSWDGDYNSSSQNDALSWEKESMNSLTSKNLEVNINLESIAKYIEKPRSMFTFLCAQDFRRDEYPWHYRNVHSEIHAGLSGWLEQRCPLAQYGCPYSQRKVLPASRQGRPATIVHSPILESFGLQPSHQNAMDEHPSMKEESSTSHPKVSSLTDLPFPILQHIATYLDSFSLSNLSLTCCLMREVCSSLLESRGIVVLRWRRYRNNAGEVAWRVAARRWQFSTAFTPIESWLLEDSSSAMAAHLQRCPLFTRNIKTWPFPLPRVTTPSQSSTRL